MLQRLLKLSDTLYNKGLAKAQANDLSGAIESLTQGLSVNRRHIPTRNLLGLLHFEQGRVGDALMHWTLSASFQEEDNLAVGYLQTLKKNGRALEKANESIRLYNSVLREIRQQDDDMVVVKLKRAVERNPKFVDAQNLLACAYLAHGDTTKAAQTAARVLAMDTNNALALYYYRMAQSERGDISENAHLPHSPFEYVSRHTKKRAELHWSGILFFLAGIGLSLAVVFILLLPSQTRALNDDITDLQHEMTQMEAAHQAELQARDTEAADLADRLYQLELSEQDWAGRYSILSRTLIVINAYDFWAVGRLQEAINLLDTLAIDGGTVGLHSEFVNRVNQIHADAHEAFFAVGMAAFQDADYMLARNSFEMSVRFQQSAPITAAFVLPELYLYLGLTFAQGIDHAQAVYYLTRFVTVFPEHPQVALAQARLSEIA